MPVVYGLGTAHFYTFLHFTRIEPLFLKYTLLQVPTVPIMSVQITDPEQTKIRYFTHRKKKRHKRAKNRVCQQPFNGKMS